MQIKYLFLPIGIFLILISTTIAQSIPRDTSKIKSLSSPVLKGKDSTSNNKDTLAQYSQKKTFSQKNDDVEDVVTFKADKRFEYDAEKENILLEKNVSMKYQNFTIDSSDVINFEPNADYVVSYVKNDSVKIVYRYLLLKENKETYKVERVSYNLKTKKGRVVELATKVQAKKAFVGKVGKMYEKEVVNVKDGYYTSCTLDHPHFYFYCPEMRIEMNKEIVARPAVLYVQDIPLLTLPFIYFPLNTKSVSGLIFPKYGVDRANGLYLKDLGYYFYINDFMDFKITGDISTLLSWAVKTRYRLVIGQNISTAVSVEYGRTNFNSMGDPDFSTTERWNINVSHNQTFDPFTKLTASINFAGGGSYSVFTSQTQNILSQDAKSNISFTRDFNDKKQGLTIGASRSQSLNSFDGQSGFNVMFYQSDIFYPFKSKKGLTSEWDNFSITPKSIAANANVANQGVILNWSGDFSTGYDLKYQFNQGSNFSINNSFSLNGQFSENYVNTFLKDRRWGASAAIPLTIGGTIAKFFRVSAGINFNAYLTDQTTRKTFDATKQTVVIDTTKEIVAFQNFSLTASFSTDMYGTLYIPFLEKIGLKALRHKFSPSISYSYTPDFTTDVFGYYRSYVDGQGVLQKYSKFETAKYQGSFSEAQSISISLANTFEAKTTWIDTVGKKNESKDQNTQFLSVSLSSAYNFVAKERNLSPISISVSSPALQFITLSANATLNPYSYNDLGQDINRYLIDDRGQLVRLSSLSIDLSKSFTGQRKSDAKTTDTKEAGLLSDFQSISNNISFGDTWSLSLSLRLGATEESPLKPLKFAGQFNVNAKMQITKGWDVGASFGYSIADNKILLPTILIKRDFHCWDMSLTWVPFGEFQRIQFSVGFTADELKMFRYDRSSSGSNFSNPFSNGLPQF